MEKYQINELNYTKEQNEGWIAHLVVINERMMFHIIVSSYQEKSGEINTHAIHIASTHIIMAGLF